MGLEYNSLLWTKVEAKPLSQEEKSQHLRWCYSVVSLPLWKCIHSGQPHAVLLEWLVPLTDHFYYLANYRTIQMNGIGMGYYRSSIRAYCYSVGNTESNHSSSPRRETCRYVPLGLLWCQYCEVWVLRVVSNDNCTALAMEVTIDAVLLCCRVTGYSGLWWGNIYAVWIKRCNN